MSNILVIEDDTVTATMLEAGLKKSGYQVTVAGLPSVASETLKTEAFDVILLDIGLPEVNGFEFATTLRNFGYKGHILMLSSLSKTEDIVKGLDAGADDYVTKPFVFDELLARVRAMV